MSRIKICPECSAEYFSHIERCADCGSVLLTPEEKEKILEEKKRCMEKSLKESVAVRQGGLEWMNELYNVLIDSGISCTVSSDDGCNKGCCGDTCRLLVSSQDAEKANDRIEEYCAELHPELQASREMMSEGKCPACGSPVNPDAVECKDCGLILVIDEDK